MTAWQIKAPLYSRLRRLPPFHTILQQEKARLSRLLPLIDTPISSHLDVGSGTGDTLSIFPEAPFRLCLDSSARMLKQADARAKVVSDALRLPFPNHSFSFVSAIGLLEYLDQADTFFQEVRRILMTSGYFLFTSSPVKLFSKLRIILGEPLHLYQAREIRDLLHRAGLAVKAKDRSWLQEQWLAQKID